MKDGSIWKFPYARRRATVDFVPRHPVASNRAILKCMILLARCNRTMDDRVPGRYGLQIRMTRCRPRFKDFVPKRRGAAASLASTRRDRPPCLLTHLHFDHAGHLDVFSTARIFVQRTEYES